MAWDFSTDADFQKDLDWIRQFVDEEVIPLELISRDFNQKQLDALLAPLKDQVRKRGLWAAHLGAEHGGVDLGQLKLALMHEILGRCVLAPEVFGNQAPDSGNAELIAAGANAAQRKRWLEPLMRNEVRSAFAMTEPDRAGSDPTGIQTSCIKKGDEWVINGKKWFCTNASIADFLVVMVVTEPKAPRHQRAAMVIVPKDTPGLVIERDVPTMGHFEGAAEVDGLMTRAGGHAALRFENCRVPLDHMIGEPGEGFILAQKRLGGGRIHHAMRTIGQCYRAFEMMKERAVSRTSSHGMKLADMQMVQAMIAESYTELQTARLLTLHAAWHLDREGGKKSRKEIALVKLYVPRVMLSISDRAIQIHGSLGYSSDMPLEEMYRMGRALRIADGADELHQQTIARDLLRDQIAVDGWPSEHIPTRAREAEKRYGHLLEPAIKAAK
jgi:acyl-CoA dehydrogenase